MSLRGWYVPLCCLLALALPAASWAGEEAPPPAAPAATPPPVADPENLPVTLELTGGTLLDLANALAERGVNVAGVDLDRVGGIYLRVREVRLEDLVDALDDLLDDSPAALDVELDDGILYFRPISERTLEVRQQERRLEVEREHQAELLEQQMIAPPPPPPPDGAPPPPDDQAL